VPVLIETVTYWEDGFGKFNWIIWKNVVVCIFGLLALVFGSKDAIIDIMKLYSSDSTAVNATTTTILALTGESATTEAIQEFTDAAASIVTTILP
jgi:hypothetical protein